MKLYEKLIYIAFILIFIGMTITLDSVIKDCENKDTIIQKQKKEILDLKRENEKRN